MAFPHILLIVGLLLFPSAINAGAPALIPVPDKSEGSRSFPLGVLDGLEAPTLSLPPNGSSVCDTTPYFAWSSVSGATWYDIQVDNNPGFSSPEINDRAPNPYYIPGAPLSPGTFHWRVQANSDEEWSTVWSFTIPPVLSAPILHSPSDGSDTCNMTPDFDWSSVSGAMSYHIQVDDNSGFSSPEINTSTPNHHYTPGSPLSPGAYYWRVRASNSCEDGPQSLTWDLGILSTPPAPDLDSPSDASSTCDTTPEFEWSSVSGATSYRIQVDDNSSFSSPEIDTPTSNHYYTPEPPLSPGTYYWHVLASNSCGDGLWSYTWSVTILSTPSAPGLSSPPNGSTISDTIPTFTWDSVSAAISYTIQVDNASDFNSPEISQSTSSPSYTPDSALPDDTYYWRVSASNSCGSGSWAMMWQFTVETICATPPAPYLFGPLSGSSTCDRSPYFNWATVNEATSYRIQVDDDPNFSSPEINTPTLDSYYMPESSLPPGTCYWRVLASNSCGDSLWSPNWSVTILSTPSAPSLSSPSHGSTISGDAIPTFTWDSVSTAISYTIQVDDNSGFNSPEINHVSPSPSYTLSSTLPDGVTYYWHVQGSNPCGSGQWSARWEFTIPAQSPLEFMIYLPIVVRGYPS
ncbi:MAG: hypothetical protein SWK90_15535 [Chloroflexota bacterium]|nr:hypothetical protein [Chloroflexota bacterium]